MNCEKIILTCLCFSFLLMLGCAFGGKQFSSLYTYNGKLRQDTDECLVVRTSLEQNFSNLFDTHKDSFMGDSRVETSETYLSVEAGFDCMAVGAKTAIVLDKGISHATSTYIPVSSVKTFQSTSYYGYTKDTEIRAYVIAFFKEKLPLQGLLVSQEKYESWKGENRIKECLGCRQLDKTK